MPRFIYKAKSGPGKTLEGELIAVSRAAALLDIDARGLTPVWVKEAPSAESRRTRKGRVRRRDITVFTRQLASLLRSGVPILRALSTVKDQSETAAFSELVGGLEASVQDGQMLSDAMTQYPRHFSELFINMVRSGESGGVLDDVLKNIAQAREKEDEINRKIQSALAYPLLVLVVGVLTVFVLLAFFLPRITALFDNYADLPLPTRILMGVSGFFSVNWPWMLLGVVFICVFVREMAKRDKGRSLLDGMRLRLPLFGKPLLQAEIARFARTLAMLLESGVAIENALRLSELTLRNAVLREEVERVRKRTVTQGMPLSTGLKTSPYFPTFVSNMMAVGEEGGQIENALGEIAEFFEKEVDQYARIATSLLEPILILVVGGIVGFIVAAMLMPIFRVGTNM